MYISTSFSALFPFILIYFILFYVGQTLITVATFIYCCDTEALYLLTYANNNNNNNNKRRRRKPKQKWSWGKFNDNFDGKKKKKQNKYLAVNLLNFNFDINIDHLVDLLKLKLTRECRCREPIFPKVFFQNRTLHYSRNY